MKTIDFPIGAPARRLDATWHPGTRGDIVVVLGHGLTGHKDRPLLVAIAERLSALGYPCLRFSFSGHGKSGGDFREITLEREKEDLRTILDGLPPRSRVVYIGHSMGAAVGVLAAAGRSRPDFLVTLAGMCETRVFHDRHLAHLKPGSDKVLGADGHVLGEPLLRSLRGLGDTRSLASAVTCPWLLLHGGNDALIPETDSITAARHAGGPVSLFLYPEADHAFNGHEIKVAHQIEAWLHRAMLDLRPSPRESLLRRDGAA